MFSKYVTSTALAVAISVCVAGIASPAFAQGAPTATMTCAQAAGGVILGGSGDQRVISIEPGQQLNFFSRQAHTRSVTFFNAFGLGNPNAADPAIAPAGTVVVQVRSTGTESNIPFTCTGTPTAAPTAATSSTSPRSQSIVNTTIATVSATAQGSAIGAGAFSGASDQFGQGGNNVTRDTVFVSSQGLPNNQPLFGSADWNAWVSAERRNFSGGNDGDSFDIVAGAGNRVSNDLIIGGLVAYGQSDMTVNGQKIEGTAPALGVYAARRFGDDLRFDISFAYARPDYQVTGGRFSATRQILNLGLRGSHAMGRVNLEPFARLSAFRENQASYTIGATTVPRNQIEMAKLSIGGQITPLAPYANGILPYLSLAGEFNHRETTTGGNTTLWSPRLGFGMSMALENGFLTVDFDGGQMLDNTNDRGLKIAYQWNF